MLWAPTSTPEDPNASLVLHTNRAVWLLRSWRHDISLPIGDIRNDLYLTLEKGDFERGGKSVQKNIEVTMYVLYADGEILKVRLASQFGKEANPIIILISLWTLFRDPFLGRLLRSSRMHSLPFLQGNPAACFDNDFVSQNLFRNSFQSDLNPSCSNLDLFPLVVSYMLLFLQFCLASSCLLLVTVIRSYSSCSLS